MTRNNNAGLFESGNWNENNLNPLTSINWRASLVPAAAVIPAPIAYIKVVAVKKLVVGFLVGATGRALICLHWSRFRPSSRKLRMALSCRVGDPDPLL